MAWCPGKVTKKDMSRCVSSYAEVTVDPKVWPENKQLACVQYKPMTGNEVALCQVFYGKKYIRLSFVRDGGQGITIPREDVVFMSRVVSAKREYFRDVVF